MSKLNRFALTICFLAALCLATALPGLPASCSAGTVKRIILMETMPVPVVKEHTRWFMTQLGEMGYRQGENMELSLLEPDGDRKRAEALLKSALAKGRPDLVVTSATLASLVAAGVLEGTGIPLLFMTVSDPVGAGLITAVGAPTGSNITGKVHMISRDTRIDMVMRLIGESVREKPVRMGFVHSSYPSAVGDIRELTEAARGRGDILFIPFTVDYRKVPEGLPAMLEDAVKGIQSLRGKVDFWWEPSGPLGEVAEYTRALLSHSKKPIVMGTKLKSVEMGALLHLTPSIEGSGRETAMLADAILKGKDPGTIPVAPPDSFELGINLDTALSNNMVVPPDLLELAGEQIYPKERP